MERERGVVFVGGDGDVDVGVYARGEHPRERRDAPTKNMRTRPVYGGCSLATTRCHDRQSGGGTG